MTELTVKEIQILNMEIMRYVDDICRKESITYYLAYGTLLGAVRERGFIPWDDDVDIFMRRDEFEKFSRVIQKYPHPRYFFQTYKTDSNFLVPSLARICINGTYGWPASLKKRDFHTGIYFDIFPLDFGSRDKRFLHRKYSLLHKFQNLLYAKSSNLVSFHGIKIMAVTILQKCFSYRFLIRSIVKWMGKFKENDEKHLVSFGCQYAFEKNYYNAEDFECVVYMAFEDMRLPCPIGYQNILSAIYGKDYMTPRKTKEMRITAYCTEERK